MIHILHIIHKYRGDYSLLNLQVALDPEKYRTVVCYLSGDNDGCNGLDAAGVKTIYLGFPSRKIRFHNLSLLSRLKAIIESEDIHVVNCQQHRSTPVGILAARMAANRPAVLSTLHGLGTAKTVRRRALNSILYRGLHRLIGISHSVSSDIRKSNWRLPAEKVVTVQNGLEYDRFPAALAKASARERFLPGEQGGLWFGTAGRLSAVKNHRTLIEAFCLVAEQRPDSRLLIAGDGDLRQQLSDLAEALGVGPRVHFLGYRSDIPELFKALDVFLLPSLREGLPLVLLEGMAAGLPVVASAVGGIPEVVSGQEFGILVAPTDVEGLAGAMLEMATLPEQEREKRGALARARALEQFSAARMIRDYEAVYREAFDARKMRPGQGNG